MNRKQINHLNMQESLLAHFDANQAIWIGKKPIERDVARLRVIVTAVRDSGITQQDSDTKGYTAGKNVALDNILRNTLRVALQVKDYAIEKKNEVLKASVNFTSSTLDDGPEKEILNRCELIVQKAKLNVTALAADGYEVTDAGLDALALDIAAARKLSPERDVVGGTRTGVTANLPALIAEGKALIKKLDGLVYSMLTDQAFLDTYEALRFINDRRGRNGGGDHDTPED